MVTLIGSPFKGNQLKAETGKIVHFWLLVDGLASPAGEGVVEVVGEAGGVCHCIFRERCHMPD